MDTEELLLLQFSYAARHLTESNSTNSCFVCASMFPWSKKARAPKAQLLLRRQAPVMQKNLPFLIHFGHLLHFYIYQQRDYVYQYRLRK